MLTRTLVKFTPQVNLKDVNWEVKPGDRIS